MRAVTIGAGRELSLADHPDPAPKAGEILVHVAAAGLNAADILQRAGHYPPPPGIPDDIPGLELAGTVVACGPGANRFHEGDRVMALTSGAGQAELATVHESLAIPVPEALTWPEAGGFCEVFVTAYDALFTQAGLQIGDRLCVTGAAGGVGCAAIQLGHLAGARVTASLRDSTHAGAIEDLGATRVLAPDAVAENGPYDVILELVSGPALSRSIDALETGGRVIVIGTGGGAHFECNLLTLMTRRAQLRGSTLRSRPMHERASAIASVTRHVLPLISSGLARVPVAATFPFTEAGAAYDRFVKGGKLGKIVLVAG